MFWTTAAYAMGAGQQAGAAGGNVFLSGIAPLIPIFIVFYFMLIRPQQKRAKEHKSMLEALAKGDRVLTAGGLYGRVNGIDGDMISLDLGTTVVTVGRGFISMVVDAEGKPRTNRVEKPAKADKKEEKK